jgi:predicted ATP-binding protein involved in virulence
MKLHSIKLKNFRSHRDLQLPLHEKLTVIVGNNGSGKTSVLDGIMLALAPILTRLPFDKKAKVATLAASDIRLTGEDTRAAFVRIDVSAEHHGESLTWDRARLRDQAKATKQEAAAEPIPRKELKELYSFVDRLTYAHNNKQPYDLPVFAIYGTNRAVDVPQTRLQKRAIPKAFSRLAGLEKSLSPKTDFRLSVAAFDLLEQRELREGKAREDLKYKLPALAAIRTAIERVVSDIQHPHIDGDSGRFAVETKDATGTHVKLYLDQLSDGYQIILGVVMDFATRLALAAPEGASADDILNTRAILIIDEVDLHLHPSWQQRVLGDLQKAFPATQIISTTHSPQVLTTVPTDCIRILKDGTIYAAPAGTDGAEAQRLLKSVFGVDPRPDTPMAKALDEYLRLVDAKQWDSARAIELRKELDAWSQGNEPRLLEADIQIDNLKWEAGQ